MELATDYSAKSIICLALGASAAAAALAASIADAVGAEITRDGRRTANRDGVPVRSRPFGPARDNLDLGDNFRVTGHLNNSFVFGYKESNGVRGFVHSSSLSAA